MTNDMLKEKRPRRARSAGTRIAPCTTLADRVVKALREEIIAGRIAADEKIAEQAMADRLGVSRVPVREATLLLEREGLLVRSATGRRRVRVLDDHDLLEIAELRMLIEPRLAALAAERHHPADAAAIDRNIAELCRATTASRIAVLDAEFHDLVAAASHHRCLADMWQMTRGQMLLLIAAVQRTFPQTLQENRESTVENHRRLWALIRDRDAAAAAAYVERSDGALLTHVRAIARSTTPPPTAGGRP